MRETFLLEGGRIACACQKNRAVFWDLSTGKEARRLDQRIYGFSPAEDWFFTDSSEELSVYSYPAMTVACRLKKDRPDGPDAHRISPDGHYLAVVFSSGRPSSDQAYPRRDPVYKSIRSSRLYDVAACAAVSEFSALDCVQLGEFTDDECSYILKNATISIDGHPRRGDWRFDLPSRSVRQAD